MSATSQDWFGKRLHGWFHHLDLSPSQASALLEVSLTSLYRYQQAPDLMPKTGLILKIHAVWPQLNLGWLITGLGAREWQLPTEPDRQNHDNA
ncbi:MAG: hypothetical protein AAFQ98_20945, partial [Bacteroidota bacterium]